MCTLEKRGRVYVLTITGGEEHRLNPTLISAIRAAVARVRSAAPPGGGGSGSALVTAAEGKFFSNGFDLAWAKTVPAEHHAAMVGGLRRAVADLLSLPMPTIAAVTGHAAAAGCLLALSHDYVLMRADRGFFYMSELDIGVRLPDYFNAALRDKIPAARTRRDVVMRPARMTAAEAESAGVVDRAVGGGAAAVVEEAVRMGEELAARNWNGEVYASARKGVFPEMWRAVAEKGGGDGDEDQEEKEKKGAAGSRL